MAARICKVVLLIAVGFFCLIVVLNNALFDYKSNYEFVRHVLSMDTLFSKEAQAWRALRDPTPDDHSYLLYHAFYWLIIAWEFVAGALCLGGAWQLRRALHAPAARFNAAKRLALYGLTLSLLQWLTAFLTIGAEWFLMWQSSQWNGQNAAFRMFTVLGIILIFISLKDEDSATEA